MSDELAAVAWPILALLLGLTTHGICIRFRLLRALARPVDGGARFRGRRLLGDNKTYRGLVAVALGTGGAYALLATPLERAAGLAPPHPLGSPRLGAALVGAAVGLAAMLGELPNSFLKRRLGIAPGRTIGGAGGALLFVLDQVDLLPGMWLALAPFAPVTPTRVLLSVAVLTVAHQLLSFAGYALGMRATAR